MRSRTHTCKNAHMRSRVGVGMNRSAMSEVKSALSARLTEYRVIYGLTLPFSSVMLAQQFGPFFNVAFSIQHSVHMSSDSVVSSFHLLHLLHFVIEIHALYVAL